MSTAGLPDVQEQARLLIVDDEEMVLSSIRTFLKLEESYQVECFTDPPGPWNMQGRTAPI